jgi:uncharacterized protein with beta-barrel porin domain
MMVPLMPTFAPTFFHRLPRLTIALAVSAIIALTTPSAALAQCAPTASAAPVTPATGTTVTCAGTVNNQNTPNGYGTGDQSGLTIDVSTGATVTGTGNPSAGIALNAGNIINNAGAISAFSNGVTAVGDLTVNNVTSGTIFGNVFGIDAGGQLVLTNAGSVTSSTTGISAASVNITNSGTISGPSNGVLTTGAGVIVNSGTISSNNVALNIGTDVNVNNASGGTISGPNTAIIAGGSVTLDNAGMVTSFTRGVNAGTSANVINRSTGTISGNVDALVAGGAITLDNAGSVTSFTNGVNAGTSANVLNRSTGTITGTTNAILTFGDLTLDNAGSITSSGNYSVNSGGNANVVNRSTGNITGVNAAIITVGGVTLDNSGIIDATLTGVNAGTSANVTNSASGTIFGNLAGINAGTSATVNNAGSITSSTNGIEAGTSLSLVNSGTISGPADGVLAGTTGIVTNSGSITSFTNGIYITTAGTVTNRAGGTISGSVAGIRDGGNLVLNNAGSITSMTDGINVATGQITNTGTVSAPLGLNFTAGPSTVFNAGSITGTGGVAIQFAGAGNILTLGPGSTIVGSALGTGADTLQLGGTGAGSFDVSAIGVQYQGFSTFNKVDASTWTLTGTSTYAGPVNVDAGQLIVTGSIASTSLTTINASAMLSGTGTLGNTTVNGGVLSPGNPTGTLVVQGNLAFTSAAGYMIQIAGAANGRTNVTGNAALAGTVDVATPTNLRFNSAYTVLTSASLNGTRFGGLATPVGITGSLMYSATTVTLSLSSGLGQIAGLNTNQRNVGSALDTAFNAAGGNGGPQGAVFVGNVPQNLTQVSGETATGTQQTTFDAMNLFMGVMTDPFIAGRGDSINAGGNPSGYAEQDGALGYAARHMPNDALAAITTKAPRAPNFEQRWSTWVAGFGGSQTTDGNATLGSNTATSQVYASAVGADYRFSRDTLAGFALAGGGTNFSVANGGSGRSDLFQAGAFVRHTQGAAYVSAALAYGWQDETTDRTVTVGGADVLRARFNANAFSGRFEGGYRFIAPVAGGVGITPYAAAQFTTFELPAYAEGVVSGSGAFALAYGAKSVTDPRSELGFRTDKSYALTDSILTLRGRLAWAHDYDPDRSIAATFQALPLASFVVNGASQASESALTTASAELKWTNGWSAAATFEGEFSEVTSSYAGKGVVRYAW